MKPADALAQLWAAKELDMEAIGAVDISTWKTYQLVYFLDKVLQRSPLPPGETAPVASPARRVGLLGAQLRVGPGGARREAGTLVLG